jgi:hypothetical protein
LDVVCWMLFVGCGKLDAMGCWLSMGQHPTHNLQHPTDNPQQAAIGFHLTNSP